MSDMVYISKHDLQALVAQEVQKAIAAYFEGHTIKHIGKKNLAVQTEHPQTELQSRYVSAQQGHNDRPIAKSSVINESLNQSEISNINYTNKDNITTLNHTGREEVTENTIAVTTPSEAQQKIAKQQEILGKLIKQIYSTCNKLSNKANELKTKNNLSEKTLQILSLISLKLWAAKDAEEKSEYQEIYLKLKLAQEKIQKAIIDKSKAENIILNKLQEVIKDAKLSLKTMQHDLKNITKLSN